MGKYRNFKMAIYCTAQNMYNLSAESLERQYAFFDKYCGCDKVYIEPYRDGLMLPEDQLDMLKRFFTGKGLGEYEAFRGIYVKRLEKMELE